jgi:hypothetical protein
MVGIERRWRRGEVAAAGELAITESVEHVRCPQAHPSWCEGCATIHGLCFYRTSNFQYYNHLVHQFLNFKFYFSYCWCSHKHPNAIFFIASALLNNPSVVLCLLYTYSSIHLIIGG